MAIKIRRKDKPGKFNYKSSKQILTPEDIKFADHREQKLAGILLKSERFLLKGGFLSSSGLKKNPLKVWYVIGSTLNNYLKDNSINREEQKLFWKDLYERETLLHKNIHKVDIAESRNDYKIATFLSERYAYNNLQNIGSWALVREIFSYKSIVKDQRIINLVVSSLIKENSNRDTARPFIKKVSGRFKFMETSVLTDKELEIKFSQINFLKRLPG